MSEPLDRPVWHALTGRLAHLAERSERAVRFRPDVNILGAAADASSDAAAALAALVPPKGTLGTVESKAMPPLPGLVQVAQAQLAQMTLGALTKGGRAVPFAELGEADAADMLALATLTKPGPFLAATHRAGGFIGVRDDEGRLIAMAGERMKLPDFSEVSGVCTHPDARGRGLASALMRVVIGRILARGEQAFLHAYASNTGAIALYEALGFRVRREVIFTTWIRSGGD